MNINPGKLDTELRKAGIETSGCNSNGVVWDMNGYEIQDRADVSIIIAAHDPKEVEVTNFIYPISAPDFIVQTPKINSDPEKALDEAIAEMEKDKGSPKSVALIALSMAKYLKAKKTKLK